MTASDSSLSTALKLLELMGYDVVESTIAEHAELGITILSVTLATKPSHITLEELALSLQTIVRGMVMQQLNLSEEFAVSIDIDGHLSTLITDLRSRARLYSDRAMTFGVPVRMDPLPAFHRKIIHTFLQNTPGIHTESFGVGRDRHIVITVQES